MNTASTYQRLDEHSDRNSPWSPFSQIMPSLDANKDQVILSDAWRRKRVAVERTALLDLLTELFRDPDSVHPLMKRFEQMGMLGLLDLDDETRRHATHWWQRGWIPSLDLYLWSRHSNFVDWNDIDGNERRTVLAYYLSQEQPPERLVPMGAQIELPKPAPIPDDLTLGKALIRRRTIRKYALDPVPLAVFSGILWHGNRGVRAMRNLSDDDLLHLLRSYGVALDPYIIVYGVDDINPGIYYYRVEDHRLIVIEEGLFREEMTYLLFDQDSPKSAAWTVIWVADFGQFQWRYRHERAIRHLYFDAGRIAQEYILAGSAYTIGSFPTPATRDSLIETRLELDPCRQAPIYTLTMGWDKRLFVKE